ncbi:hypothetical protein [Halosolutus halophilus]|uniref:hypothetical protein n=1 Tax=Halosolutus halophilus TaxID=1552990 RepID=UPI00223509EC|nr:hypothetical protein [Halosolutus halophilus]
MDGNDPDDPRLDRRSYLSGGTATLSVLSLGAGNVFGVEDDATTDPTSPTDEDDATTDPTSPTSDVCVTIIETNAPVEGGDVLEVTAAVENRGETTIRPEVEQRIGGELRATIETTIAPGETETLDHSTYRTYPVAQPDDLSVRIETANAAAERTIDVLAVDELDAAQTTPGREIAVQPGTAVLFEVESDTLDEYGGGTHWFVDEAYEGHAAGPWHAAYYSREGTQYLTHTFESPGTYEVTAAVDGDERNYRAIWNVRVTPDGTAAPVIEERQPIDESIGVGRDGTTELELTVSHPDGAIDRVVWWLGHADRILGVSDVSGAEDTASLTLDGGCHGCPIIAWVIGDDGSITAERVWTIDDRTAG